MLTVLELEGTLGNSFNLSDDVDFKVQVVF